MHFRLSEKFHITISEKQQQSVLKALQDNQTILRESKIEIPSMIKAKLPREKRRFKKHRKELLNQVTDHLTLNEALRSITHIPISSLT